MSPRVEGGSPLPPAREPAYIKVMVSRTPKDLAERMSARRKPGDGFRRQTFALPRADARERARAIFKRYPKQAYMTEVESWRDLGDDWIEFTVKHLPSAD